MESRTPEHQARVDRMRAKLAAMTEEERQKTVTVLDHILGFGDDDIDEMSEEEVDAFLRAEGIDPEASFHAVMGAVLAGLSKTCMDLRARLREAVNASCTCGGAGPGEGCPACEVWHQMTGSD